MATIRLPPDFKEFLKLLNANEIEYLVIGGYAVGYHGYPRATVDLDIWIGTDPRNCGKLLSVLKTFGFETAGLTPEAIVERDRIIRMGLPPVRIELFTLVSGLEFPETFAKRIVGDLDGVDVNLISLDDLKLNKKASGRLKDLNDLENLT